jgi:hypothetical protein
MKYDFVEIGTSNFETFIELANDNTIGLSVEPLKYYLDKLPNKKNVKKLNCAISRNNKHEQLEIYYIPESVIVEKKLSWWLKGCNTVNSYHPLHKKLNITHLVNRELISCVPIGYLFDLHNITELDYLKIDTEGSDCDILLHFFEYLKHKKINNYPKTIKFESNENALLEKLQLVKSNFISLGYQITNDHNDTTMKFIRYKE